tara:strand:+ start:185 stop:1381 length:1197 start_codon:yes stop_codon:yes gene_type:complete
MLRIDQIDISNKRILIRVDFNVPMSLDGQIKNSFRLDASLRTIQYCIDNNASVVLMSHLGRPKGKGNGSLSLFPIIKYLKNKFKKSNVSFIEDCISKSSFKITSNLNNKDIVLLENLRYYDEELIDDNNFAHLLSKHGDIYINDAFGTSHREHASNSAILKYYLSNTKAIGFLFDKELKYLSHIDFINSKVITVILGGAKISSKISMLKYFLDKCNCILIGGAMAFTFIKSKGYNIGKSLYEDSMLKEAEFILKKAEDYNVKILLPLDFVCSTEYSEDSLVIRDLKQLKSNEMGLDIGPKTIELFKDKVKASNTIIWNGPLGAFEMKAFAAGTNCIAKCISKYTKSKTSIIGGGDTASSIINLNLENYFTHVSTGGGASLELLSGQKLKFINSWEKYE